MSILNFLKKIFLDKVEDIEKTKDYKPIWRMIDEIKEKKKILMKIN